VSTVAPYQPKRRRRARPEVAVAFWRGLYYASILGLPLGMAFWGFIALGGGPVLADRNRAVVSLAGCGLVGALAAASWVWGALWLDRFAPALIEAVALRLRWLVHPFVERAAEDREGATERAAWGLARALMALPVGVPGMILHAATPLTQAGPVLSTSLVVGGLVVWLMGAHVGWSRLLAPVPVPPPPPSGRDVLNAARDAAEYDSALQLAVAKAKRAKAVGQNEKAIKILEAALREAAQQGRSVAHVELHWYLAWLYAAEGDATSALVMFETVQELAGPGSAQATGAAEAIQRLQRKLRGFAPAAGRPAPPPDVEGGDAAAPPDPGAGDGPAHRPAGEPAAGAAGGD
jgi:hypothetical protein